MTTGRHGAREPGALLFAALVAITFVGPLSIHMFLPALPFVRQAFAVDQSAAQLTYGLFGRLVDPPPPAGVEALLGHRMRVGRRGRRNAVRIG